MEGARGIAPKGSEPPTRQEEPGIFGTFRPKGPAKKVSQTTRRIWRLGGNIVPRSQTLSRQHGTAAHTGGSVPRRADVLDQRSDLGGKGQFKHDRTPVLHCLSAEKTELPVLWMQCLRLHTCLITCIMSPMPYEEVGYSWQPTQ
jgi:hypothetical protein